MRLFRISNILFLGAAVTLGVLLFWTSQAVQKKEDTLAGLKNKLSQERESVRVLSVEWDYLNRPQRLEELAIEIGMVPPQADGLVRSAGDIPEPAIAQAEPSYDEGVVMQPVSMTAPKPAPARRIIPVKADAVVSPSKAEKQDFDRLIQTLNGGGQ